LAGPTKTLRTPFSGARKLNLEPSGLMRAVTRSGLPNSTSLEMRARLFFEYSLSLLRPAPPDTRRIARIMKIRKFFVILSSKDNVIRVFEIHFKCT
jgi:hypothetical protein